jgi:glycerol-3-phosphate dehydrogenase
MTRDLSALTRETFDVLVIGGGIYGLTAAYEGALAGLRVALVERRDFGSGTSFHHLKTLHGGRHYLQRGAIRLMRDSIGERRTFVRLAPQLISAQPFVMPIALRGATNVLALRAAMAAEALIGFDRNTGIHESHHLPAGRMLAREELAAVLPEAEDLGAAGAALWYDYRIDEGDRLTLAFAIAAVRQGAVLANYSDAFEPLRAGQRISGMRVRDEATGEMLDVRATVTLNAAGGAAGRLMALFGARYAFPLVKAFNVVTTRPATAAAICLPDVTGRLLVALPWRERLVIGTMLGRELCGPDDTLVGTAELDTALADANRTFPWLRLTRDDVRLVHRGAVPARVRPGQGPSMLESAGIRDHRRDGIEGAVSLIGASYTTARLTAERAVALIARRLGRRLPKSLSSELPLLGPLATASESTVRPGRARMSTAERVSRLYGATAARVLGMHAAQRETEAPVGDGADVTIAEVLEAVRHEMALTLEDVVVRRTALGATGFPGDALVTACGRILQSELGWSEERFADEVSAVRRFYEPVLSPTVESR